MIAIWWLNADYKKGTVVVWKELLDVPELWEKLKSASVFVRNTLANGRAHVAVVGPSGCGKSTLGRQLAFGFEEAMLPRSYMRSAGPEFQTANLPISNSLTVFAGVDSPSGTQFYKALNHVKGKSNSGIVFVCAKGYQAIYNDAKSVFGEINGDVKAAYALHARERHEQLELRLLESLVQDLLAKRKELPSGFWVVVMMLKEDIWWNERTEVNESVRSGVIFTQLEMLRDNGIQAQFVSSSLCRQNVLDGNDLLLAEVCQGYDDRRFLDSRFKLQNTIHSYFEIDAHNE